MNDATVLLGEHGGLEYLGLAPFLRASIAGADLRQATQHMLELLPAHPDNPNLLMNLSLAAQCLNQAELGLAYQAQALSIASSYTVAARVQPPRLRLLVLVAQGSMQSNSPLECLLEVSDIELVFHYIAAGDHLLSGLPPHDVLFVGIADSDAHRPLLQALDAQLQGWPQPVLNLPRHIPHTGRDRASQLLGGIPRLQVPPTVRAGLPELYALAMGQTRVPALLAGCDFPVIVRPLASQAGTDLRKIDNAGELALYLGGLDETQYFLAPYVDYRDAQGQFRKIRIAFVRGQAFVCHMGVSSDWMVHYVNAGMYEEPWKRQEEARFMAEFPHFLSRHQPALDAICQRMQLDYLVMDCAETPAGELLLFEIDHGGVVHGMDVESLFPYKNAQVHKVQQAFTDLLYACLPQTAPA